MIRLAAPEDAAALLRLYGQYIDTTITFEYTLPDEAAFRARIEDIRREYPYLVCEREGAVLGYAYAHRYRERAAYQWGAELSVYVDRDAHGRGVGRRLYTALMELLRLQGVRSAYGCVTMPNDKSAALHTALGFSLRGTMPNAGFKNGRWHDTAWYAKALLPYDAPTPFLPLHAVDGAEIERILQNADSEA